MSIDQATIVAAMNISINLTFYAWIGWVITTSALAFLYVISGYLGMEVFRRLVRIYHMAVIIYWLGRLEAGGVRVFQKAKKEDAEWHQDRCKSSWDAPLPKSKKP